MSSLGPPRTNWTAIISVALTVASMYAFGIRYVVRLNEADETRKEQIRELQNADTAMKADYKELKAKCEQTNSAVATDIAVIRERVDWLVKAQQQKRGR